MYTFQNVLGIYELTMLKNVSPHQWTPLHLAATSGHVDIARLLVDKGADISSKDTGGVSK